MEAVSALLELKQQTKKLSPRPSVPLHLSFQESLVLKLRYILRRGMVNIGKCKPQGNSFPCTVIKMYVESVATGAKNRSQ